MPIVAAVTLGLGTKIAGLDAGERIGHLVIGDEVAPPHLGAAGDLIMRTSWWSLAIAIAIALAAGSVLPAAAQQPGPPFQVGDRVLLHVEGDSALSDTFTVVAGPALRLPDIGEISLAGVRRTDLESHLQHELSRYIKDPVVQARALIRVSVTGEVARLLNEGALDLSSPRFQPSQIAEVFRLQDAGTLSSTAAKDVIAEVLKTGKAPAEIVREKGLAQVSDESALLAAVDAVIARSGAEVAKYKAGKKNLLGFFVGQAMKDLKGKGNPGVLNSLFKKRLD